MGNIEIKAISCEEFSHLIPSMRKERVGDSTHNTNYFGAFDGDKLVGVVGWMMVGHIIRYKTDYVIKEYRGRGIYSMLFTYRDDYFRVDNIVYTAFCTKMSIGTYMRNGFIPKREKNGITFVERVK